MTRLYLSLSFSSSTETGKQGMCYNTHAKQTDLLCANRPLLVGEDIPKPLGTHNACAAARPLCASIRQVKDARIRKNSC